MRMRAAARTLLLLGALALLSAGAGTASVVAAAAFGRTPSASNGSDAARALHAGGLSRLDSLLQQPRFELFTGAAVLAALGLFLAWKAFEARTERGRTEETEPAATVASVEPATVQTAAVVPPAIHSSLPPLADRFRPLSALRAHDNG